MSRLLLFALLTICTLGLSAQVWFEQYPQLQGSRVVSLDEDASELLVGLSAPGLRNTSARINAADGQFVGGFVPVLPGCTFPGGQITVLDGTDFAVQVSHGRSGVSVTRFDYEIQTCRIRDVDYITNLPLANALDTVVTSLLVGKGSNAYVAGYLVYDTNNSYGYFVSRFNRFTGEVLSSYLGAPTTPTTPPFTIPNPNLQLGLANGDVLIRVASTGVGGGATSDFLQRITAAGEAAEITPYGVGLTSLLQIDELSTGDYALLTFTDNGTSAFYELILVGANAARLTYANAQSFGGTTLVGFRPTAFREDANGDIILGGQASTNTSGAGLTPGTAIVKTSGAVPIEDLIFVDNLSPGGEVIDLLELTDGDYIVGYGTAVPSLARIRGSQAPPSGMVDLELDIIAQSANQYTTYSNDLLLSNTGTATAHDIVVSFRRPAGTVYQGGNEFTATAGSFDPYGAQEWRIDSVRAGETVSLSAHLFLLTQVPGVTYAQVLAQAEPDADSTPGNGTPPVANEDDEASTGNQPPGGGGGGGGGTSTDVDLELAMVTASSTVGIFTVFTVDVEVFNNSANDASGVEIFAPGAAGVVYTGGNEFSATQGSFHPYGDQIWTVGDLPAGASATLSINYFLLRDDAIDFYTQVFSTNEDDADSSPRNGSCCTPVEDDEAALTINGASSQPLTLTARQLRELRPVTLTSVYPNVLADRDVVVEAVSTEAGNWPLLAYDMHGRTWDLGRLDLSRGLNVITVQIANLPSGNYRLTIPVSGLRVISQPLMVNR